MKTSVYSVSRIKTQLSALIFGNTNNAYNTEVFRELIKINKDCFAFGRNCHVRHQSNHSSQYIKWMDSSSNGFVEEFYVDFAIDKICQMDKDDSNRVK